MKKFLGFILAGILVIGSCATVFAAPPTEAPSETSVQQDGKAHNVYVFGISLTLIYADGSIEVINIGPDGRVNVMMDGVVTENISNVSIPTGQRTRMALGNGSIIVKNVTAESGEAIKEQIANAYAAGETSVDLETLTGVVVYTINENGEIVNADGRVVSINEPALSVYSIDTLAKLFEDMLKEIMAEDAARAAAEAEAAANARRGSQTPAQRPVAASGTIAPTPTPTPIPEASTSSGDSGSTASPVYSATPSVE